MNSPNSIIVPNLIYTPLYLKGRSDIGTIYRESFFFELFYHFRVLSV